MVVTNGNYVFEEILNSVSHGIGENWVDIAVILL